MNKDLIHLSKFLSLVLRHQPEKIGISLDSNGWVSIDDLLAAAGRHGVTLTSELLMQVVEGNDKQRFAMSDDGTMIRASQGHSVQIDLALDPVEPPAILYHGTATRFIDSILREGLRPGKRQHVHLSADEGTARKVGSRHGKPVIVAVRAGEMYGNGHRFFRSANGVWLTDHVPPTFLSSPQGD